MQNKEQYEAIVEAVAEGIRRGLTALAEEYLTRAAKAPRVELQEALALEPLNGMKLAREVSAEVFDAVAVVGSWSCAECGRVGLGPGGPAERCQMCLGGESIRELRLAMGMTRAQFGSAVGRRAGKNPAGANTVQRWEDGRHTPRRRYQVAMRGLAQGYLDADWAVGSVGVL